MWRIGWIAMVLSIRELCGKQSTSKHINDKARLTYRTALLPAPGLPARRRRGRILWLLIHIDTAVRG